MQKIITRIMRVVCDVLFPPICLNCKKSIDNQRQFLCENCFHHIRIHSSFFCSKCGARRLNTGRLCHTKEPYLLAPATDYEEPMPEIIRHFKYGKIYDVEFLLSAILVAYIKKINIHIEQYIITSIPLHIIKERVRGFNQSEVLAKHLSDYFGVKYEKLLTRTRFTKPQANLHIEDRKRNIIKCFSYKSKIDIKGKKIILVDDVSTTGTTLFEASRVLKKNGAKQIICLVISRA